MKTDRILLDHGSGGKISHQLIADLIIPAFDNKVLAGLDDGAVIDGISPGKLAFSTDSYVVDPIFFPGGNIGDLAINGTVNDIAMCGADPLYLSVGFIIEEGFAVSDFKKILASMKQAAAAAGVRVVTGDTKVVSRGAADKIFISTSGIGVISRGIDAGGNRARPGDRILLSGTIADHGMAIITQREGLGFASDIESDTACLNHLVKRILAACPEIRVLRDPTRGGVGTTLNEIAGQSRVGIRIHEALLPVRPAVAGVCELLGFDPLYVANEGKLLAVVPPERADAVLETVREDPAGKDAVFIGEVVQDHAGQVFMETVIGGTRIVDMLTGEQLPRIC